MLVLIVVTCACASVAVAETLPPRSVTVGPGDSWASVRNRLFPLDALRSANPWLDREILHPGDVVRAPYVSVGQLERERAMRQTAEQELAETRGRLAAIERDEAAIARRRQEVDRAEHSLSMLRAVTIVLLAVVAAVLGLFAFLVVAMRAARRNAADVASRYRSLQGRYDELRLSLHEIDVKLQQRVIALLGAQGRERVSDREISATVGAMRELGDALKERHDDIEIPPTAA